MADQPHNPLGNATEYPSEFDAGLLFKIPRAESRSTLGIANTLPFTGYDRWTSFELSWLNTKGKPEVRVAEFVINAESHSIVESKSFKLYLNSYNQTVFESEQAVIEQLIKDLSAGFGAEVKVALFSLDDVDADLKIEGVNGECIDNEDIEIDCYQPHAGLLKTSEHLLKNHLVYSHLLKTNCPITDQPDWATIYIEYSGKEIVPASLLKYIVSFRQHQGYHENCVEQIFCDIKKFCQPDKLTLYARYTRRGGLDINPLRTDNSDPSKSQLIGKVIRGIRQ